MKTAVRQPAVAGAFYPSDPDELRQTIRGLFAHRLGPGREAIPLPGLLGLVVPHAGYAYSGPVAAHAYAVLAGAHPQVAVLLGPNHRGWGPPVSLWDGGAWDTPLGSFPVDYAVVEAILAAGQEVQPDRLAHVAEHSLEVQLPFLRQVCGGVPIVAISVREMSHATARKVGQAVAAALGERRGVVIASSDFTHYEPQRVAQAKDELALAAISRLDAAGLEQVVAREEISMCGPGPVMAMLEACLALGATRAVRLAHATSGDVTGDMGAVVGYAAVAVVR
ncbi:MAG: AmmeMemoRadiSam system protein B [Thermaerobacter sp.]|nr:AmmeMemoRadiSam system protein B [Thermaerobacter sp.]